MIASLAVAQRRKPGLAWFGAAKDVRLVRVEIGWFWTRRDSMRPH